MRINVCLKGHLSCYLAEMQKELVLEVEVPITLKEVIERLGIPLSEVEGAFSGGKWIRLSETIEEGGRIDVLPIIGGG